MRPQKASFRLQRSETAQAHSRQEAEEEDTEATRVAGLRGFNKLWHKIGNKVNRPQCFGGHPSALPGDPSAQVCQGVATIPSFFYFPRACPRLRRCRLPLSHSPVPGCLLPWEPLGRDFAGCFRFQITPVILLLAACQLL